MTLLFLILLLLMEKIDSVLIYFVELYSANYSICTVRK
jgi:hypothetical protein